MEGRAISYEARGVVVAEGFGVTKGLQQRIRLQDYMLHILHAFTTAADRRDVTHNELGSFSFTSTGFTTVINLEKIQFKNS